MTMEAHTCKLVSAHITEEKGGLEDFICIQTDTHENRHTMKRTLFRTLLLVFNPYIILTKAQHKHFILDHRELFSKVEKKVMMCPLSCPNEMVFKI